MSRDRVPLSDIIERIERAVEFAGKDKSIFMASQLHQDAVIRQLEVIGEAVKRVSPETRRLANDVPWKGMAGFKDVAVHQYQSINLERVWEIVHNELPGLATKVRKVLVAVED